MTLKGSFVELYLSFGREWGFPFTANTSVILLGKGINTLASRTRVTVEECVYRESTTLSYEGLAILLFNAPAKSVHVVCHLRIQFIEGLATLLFNASATSAEARPAAGVTAIKVMEAHNEMNSDTMGWTSDHQNANGGARQQPWTDRAEANRGNRRDTHSVEDVSTRGTKRRYNRNQMCIFTYNVRSLNNEVTR